MSDYASLPELLTFENLKVHLGIPRTTAYRYMKTCDFPKPIQVGPNAVRLRKSDVMDWIDSRPAATVHDCKKVES